MEGEVTSPHASFQPEGLAPGRGFSHVVSAAMGRTVWVAGEIGADADGSVVEGGWVKQFDQALGNVVAALAAADAGPAHVVWMQIFTTDVDEYRRVSSELGPVWRSHFGRHYPAMAMVGVSGLVEPAAVVEIMATAVVP